VDTFWGLAMALPIFRGFWPRTWQIPLSRTDSGHIEGVGLSQSPFKNGNSRTFRSAAAAGLKRIFSKQSLANFGKGLIKLI